MSKFTSIIREIAVDVTLFTIIALGVFFSTCLVLLAIKVMEKAL